MARLGDGIPKNATVPPQAARAGDNGRLHERDLKARTSDNFVHENIVIATITIVCTS